MSIPLEKRSEFRARDRWLILALVVSAVTPLLDQLVSYSLVPESCSRGSKAILHLVTVTSLVVVFAAGLIGLRIHRECLGEPDTVLWKERTKWVSTVVVVLSIFMAIVIVAMEIPNLILRSCD